MYFKNQVFNLSGTTNNRLEVVDNRPTQDTFHGHKENKICHPYITFFGAFL